LFQGVVRDKLLLSGPNKRKHGSGLHSGLREWTGIGWSIPEEHPKLVVLLRDHTTLDDVKIFLDVEDGIVPVVWTLVYGAMTVVLGVLFVMGCDRVSRLGQPPSFTMSHGKFRRIEKCTILEVCASTLGLR
jgi:hypothetical protein